MQTQTLQTILNPSGYGQINMNQRNDALYFEVLDMSLKELEQRKPVKVTWLPDGLSKEVSTRINPLNFAFPILTLYRSNIR